MQSAMYGRRFARFTLQDFAQTEDRARREPTRGGRPTRICQRQRSWLSGIQKRLRRKLQGEEKRRNVKRNLNERDMAAVVVVEEGDGWDVVDLAAEILGNNAVEAISIEASNIRASISATPAYGAARADSSWPNITLYDDGSEHRTRGR